MTTSKHSQARMFDDGFTPEQALPTPTAFDAKPIRNLRADNNALEGGRHGVSLGHLIENQLDGFSQPGTRVSHSAMPGSDEARRMTVTSGRTFADSLPMPGRAGACLRTLLGTSAWDSTMCLLTWKVKATPAGRRLFRLQASAPRISGTGSGLWQTPRAIYGEHPGMTSTSHLTGQAIAADQGLWPTPRAEGFDAGGHRGTKDSLHSAVKMWPTPLAQLAKHGGPSPAQEHRDGLDSAVFRAEKMWPTPTMQDGENTAGPSQFRRNSLPLNAAVMWPTPRANAEDSTRPNGKGGRALAEEALIAAGERERWKTGQQTAVKLSAAWVSRLMGYPDGWLDLAS